MDKKTKETLLDIQLEFVRKSLNGKLSRQTLVDSRGNASKRIIIDYQEETDDEWSSW